MPKQTIEDNIWGRRLDTADKFYRSWESLFKCDILDKYYEGEQWRSQRQLGYNPYVINKVYETIQIKIANFIPTFPSFLVASRVGNEDDIATAAHSAQLKEDLLNTITQDPENNFSEEVEQAYKDSFFRFGMIEVGYAADWIENPNAPKPLLGKDTDVRLSDRLKRKIIEEPAEIPQNERVYFKHIPAKTFRVGGNDHKYLNRCGWVGYYEYVDKDDLLALKKLMNRDKVEQATVSDSEESNRETVRHDTAEYARNSLKIWHIWDLKAELRLLVLDSPKVTVFQKKYDFLPLFDLRPDRRLITNGFYPIPPAFHWLSPQDEYNETREMLRAHRRRFVRKFQVIEGMIDDEEIEKFETGPDGALIKVKRENSITPVENADLGQSVEQSIATSADDLNRISGTSDESRGVADRTTATQANIVNQRTGIRDGKERDRVVKWFSHIGRAVLLIVREKFTGKTLAKLTQAEGESFLGSVNPNKPLYRYITAEDLRDGYDFKIDVDVTSMSTTAQIDEKKKLLEYLSVLTQFPMVAFSPYLVREIAYRIGYRNEKAIAEFQQMALLMELARMNQLKQAANPAPPQMPQPGPAGQQITQQATPPGAEQIRNQLTNQLPQVAGGPVQ
jgi:hypothetical protein